MARMRGLYPIVDLDSLAPGAVAGWVAYVAGTAWALADAGVGAVVLPSLYEGLPCVYPQVLSLGVQVLDELTESGLRFVVGAAAQIDFDRRRQDRRLYRKSLLNDRLKIH